MKKSEADPKRIKHIYLMLEGNKQLTDWEKKFLASTQKQFKEAQFLSDKQYQALEKIYKQRTQHAVPDDPPVPLAQPVPGSDEWNSIVNLTLGENVPPGLGKEEDEEFPF